MPTRNHISAPVEESGRPHRPVKAKIAGSKPVRRAGQSGFGRAGPSSAASSAATRLSPGDPLLGKRGGRHIVSDEGTPNGSCS